MQKENKLYLGDCLEIMPSFENDSIDAIVTDPPYGLKFMNHKWDASVPSIEIWQECLRVLKPGAFAFVMSSPRQDVLSRMIINLEDAGFNIGFSSIYWTYACLSEDTEVLTKHGWELWHIAKSLYTHILIYNYEEDSYRWEIPAEWHYYNIEDTCYRIKSDFTDQLVTKGHHVAFEQEGKILFLLAEEIGQTVRVPHLDGLRRVQKDISFVTSTNQSSGEANGGSKILQSDMQWKRESTLQDQIQQRTWNGRTKMERRKKRKATAIDDRRKELGVERGSNIFQKAWQVCKHKICTLSQRVFKYGPQRWICNGASLIGSARVRKAIMAVRNGASYRPRSNKQQSRELNAIPRQSRSQTTRGRESYKTTLATVTEEDYEGIVFCPTVSTGCFVARRNGKIFITGNSGFPKAQNLSKQIDKRANVKQTVIGEYKYPDGKTRNYKDWKKNAGTVFVGKADKHNELGHSATTPVTDTAKAFDGGYSGFQPKPAVEVVIVAMKPIEEKGYIDQALANHHGCTWLDDCRIPFDGTIQTVQGGKKINSNNYGNTNGNDMDRGKVVFSNNKGRFPANVLCEDDVLNDGIKRKSGDGIKNSIRDDYSSNTFQINRSYSAPSNGGDEGSFSRYFSLDAWFAERIKHLPKEAQKTFPWLIVPKASKSEKDKGLEDFDYKKGIDIMASAEWQKERGRNPNEYKGNKNKHPTTKPLKLMMWLIILSSREGDVILDPFMGSGTTPLAAKMTNRYCKGIELNKEFFDISVKRLDEAQQNINRLL